MCKGCSRDRNSEERRSVKSSETRLRAAGFRQEGSRCGSCPDRAESEGPPPQTLGGS